MDIMHFLGFRRNDPVSRAIDDAIELLEAKDCDGAIAILRERALGRDPGHRRARLHLGIAHMLKGEYAAAEELLEPIARDRELDSESATARIALEKIERERSAP